MPAVFPMGAYNSLSVEKAPLSPLFNVTGICGDGEVQVIESTHTKGVRAFGVQFHPESFLSSHQDILRTNWLAEVALFHGLTGSKSNNLTD